MYVKMEMKETLEKMGTVEKMESKVTNCKDG
jgi:hypothetical protein